MAYLNCWSQFSYRRVAFSTCIYLVYTIVKKGHTMLSGVWDESRVLLFVPARRERHLVVRCLTCGSLRRYLARADHRLWSERAEEENAAPAARWLLNVSRSLAEVTASGSLVPGERCDSRATEFDRELARHTTHINCRWLNVSVITSNL